MNAMNEATGQVLDHLGYKNKCKAAAWAERLWQQHLQGTPADLRQDADRQRYDGLLERTEAVRVMARNLHLKRTRFTPRFATEAVAADTTPALLPRRAAAG